MSTIYPELERSQKWRTIPWYIRVCLWFCKERFSCDFAVDGSPMGNGVFWKSFRGRVYITDME